MYGQSKAAGDLAVATVPAHYILRTSWVIGDGRNFVRTMQDLAARGVSPEVVGDQDGRLTFTEELSRATRHLVSSGAPFGTYNATNGGPVTSWAEIAREVFRISVIRAAGGIDSDNDADARSSAGASPCQTMSTESPRFTTEPVNPKRRATRQTAGRIPTPWITPRIFIFCS